MHALASSKIGLPGKLFVSTKTHTHTYTVVAIIILQLLYIYDKCCGNVYDINYVHTFTRNSMAHGLKRLFALLEPPALPPIQSRGVCVFACFSVLLLCLIVNLVCIYDKLRGKICINYTLNTKYALDSEII